MPTEIEHWIRGARHKGEERGHGEVFDPATGEMTGRVGFASKAVVDEAVLAAAEAAARWRTVSVSRRTGVMFAFRELVARHAEEIAGVITAEHGKVFEDALGEVNRGLEVIEFACGVGELLKGEYSHRVSNGIDTYSMRLPLGVVVGISPFNFPAMVPLWLLPISIACGNAFVLKPSEKDPSASIMLAELFGEAGLPAGVMSVVHGDARTVEDLIDHEQVAAVSFVGSTPVARQVYERASRLGKRAQALGGAKNHMVVMPDADLDLAADAAVAAAFGSAGERCMAVSVLVAVEPVGDALIERVLKRAKALCMGPGRQPGSEMGPLISRPHRDRVASFLDVGCGEGAKLALDGREHVTKGSTDGFWFGPTVFDHVTPTMSVYQEEIFGPVLSVVRVGCLDEALALMSRCEYGNGAAIFSNDGAAVQRFTQSVDIGMIGVNVPIPVPVATFPFGGSRRSLFGDLHVYGHDGVSFNTRRRVVTSRWPSPQSQPRSSLNMPSSQ